MGLGTYNFTALNRWDRFRVWLGDGTGLFLETFLKCCGGVTGLGTHISPNEWLERGYPRTVEPPKICSSRCRAALCCSIHKLQSLQHDNEKKVLKLSLGKRLYHTVHTIYYTGGKSDRFYTELRN